MLSSLLAVASLALPGQTVSQPLTSDAGLTLSLFVRVYRPGRSSAGMSAGDLGTDAFESQVWSDAGLCSLSAGDDGPRSTPAVGWAFTGRVLQQAGDEALVEIDWRRRFSNGVELAAGPRGILQVTMRRGDRLVLDEIEATDPRCGLGVARVEAALSPFAAIVTVTPRGTTGDDEARGSGSGASGGVDVRAVRRARSGAAPDSSHLAQLWLVHTHPDDTEQVQMQTTAIGPGGRPFAFPPVRIPSAGGELSVAVSGVLWVRSLARQPAQVIVMLTREVRDAQGRRLADGGATKTIQVPPAGEIVSFELPPRLDRAGHLGGNRFAVRLRLSDLERAGIR
jgi:hypothetical protein